MKFIIVCGPTCTGKTSLGIKLANRYNGEIVNADSRQIYKYTTIGTAKPSEAELTQAKHHLFDFLELSEVFSAYQYAELAREVMLKLEREGKLPIVVGGTGLYLKALTEGIFKAPEPDEAYRESLEEIASKFGTEKLREMLALVDPESAEQIKPRDKIRLIRALEVHHQTGSTITELKNTGEYLPSLGEPLWLGLNYNRGELYEKINLRVDKMIEYGFEQEVKSLEHYLELLRKRKMIGYSDMIAYMFDNQITRAEAIAKVKQHHRNYAKRQLTWFKKVEKINWFNPSSIDYNEAIIKLTDKYLKSA